LLSCHYNKMLYCLGKVQEVPSTYPSQFVGSCLTNVPALLIFMEAKLGLRPLWTYSSFAEMTDQCLMDPWRQAPWWNLHFLLCASLGILSACISDKLISQRFWFCKQFAYGINLTLISYRNLEDRWWPFQTIWIQMRCFGFQQSFGRQQVSAVCKSQMSPTWRKSCSLKQNSI